MVVLSRIVTGGGDDGQTHLADMSRIAKTDPLIAAIGAVAETNALLGVARSAGLPEPVEAWAAQLQQELFDLGADLATPLTEPEMADAAAPATSQSSDTGRPSMADAVAPTTSKNSGSGRDGMADAVAPATSQSSGSGRVGHEAIERWSGVVEQLASELGPLRSFILPGGPPGAAGLHLAVTVARRAEREAWRAAQERGIGQAGGINRAALVYLNRLSDLLFQLARAAGGQTELWRQPKRHHSSEREGPASIQESRPEEAPREMTSR